MADFNSLKPLHPGSVTYVSAEEGVKELEAEFAREDEEKRKRELEEKRNPKKEQKPEVQEPSASKVITLDHYLRLENISCTDADGNVFEQYPVIYVRKDIYRNDQNHILFFTPYQAAKNAAAKGDFHPSFALSCNILAALYAQRKKPEIDAVLKQYLNKGNGNGYHGQNTIIDFGAKKVIHYPTAQDFGQKETVNAGRARTALSFLKARLENELLETALGKADQQRYIKQLTGLREPKVLIEIGEYFGQPAKLWFPWSGQDGAGYTEKRASWLGCYLYLYLSSVSNLINGGAARGVRKI
jgi:hypothetical protein